MRSKTGRYERWVEPDPGQFAVWRLAWDLLLTDTYTLEEIGEELQASGYRFRTGRPFVEIKNNRRKPSTNSLSKKFYNWFYAGWVVGDKAGIPPKTVRGRWKPVVTTEEFERGLEILAWRSRHHVAKHKHDYLLKGSCSFKMSGPESWSSSLVQLRTPVERTGVHPIIVCGVATSISPVL